MARKEITYYTCTPCEIGTGKQVTGERIEVDGRAYDLCVKHRKIVDQYVTFRDQYAEAPVRTVRNGRPSRKLTGTDRRYECGACRNAGEPNVIVAHNSRAWHASRYHDLKITQLDWHEVD